MRNKGFVALCVCVLLAMFSFGASASSPRLVDTADLLNPTEELALSAKLDTISEQYQMDVVIVTTDSTDDKSAMEFADDYYDYNGYRQDGVLLLISMEYRDWWISTTGKAINAIHDSAIEDIEDRILEDLSNGFYAEAFDAFIDKCEYYIDGAINGFPFDFGFNLIVALVVGFVAALIVTLIMKGQLKSVRCQSAASSYVKEGSFCLTQSYEMFLYRQISRTRKETNSSGGSSTHRSSSGRSHGGGGGRF